MTDQLRAVVEALGARRSGNGWTAHCPAHEDRRESLSISQGDDGKLLLHCHAGCTYEAILGRLPTDNKTATRAQSREIARYAYANANGTLAYYVLRFEPKDFRLQAANGSWSVKGVERLPYRLPQLRKACGRGDVVAIVEGEKDADNLSNAGICATTFAGGANGKLPEALPSYFSGARLVAILPDNDAPGRQFAERVARELHAGGVRLKIVELAGLPEKGDASDWLASGGTVEELHTLVETAPPWEPTAAAAPAPTTKGDKPAMKSRESGAVEIRGERLTLSALVSKGLKRYKVSATDPEGKPLHMDSVNLIEHAARVRFARQLPEELREEFSALAMRLAEKVEASRPQEGPGAVEAVTPAEEPWPEEVTTAEVLGETLGMVRRFVVLPDDAGRAVALWVLHTYVVPAFDYTPYLHVSSAVRECGKTTLLETLYRLAFKAQLTGGITAAALYRRIDRAAPTMLLDELDARLKGEGSENLRGVLNTGFARSGKVTICVGDNHEEKDFSTFCPKVLAGIGRVWDTVSSRSIPVRMEKATKQDLATVEKIRGDTLAEICHATRRKLLRWSDDTLAALRESDPECPAELGARESDIWRPLFAIADAAGEEWGKRARAAAISLHNGGDEEQDYGLILLADLRDQFNEATEAARSRGESPPTGLFTDRILEALVKRDDRPWKEYYKDRRPITDRGLAKLLGRFRIKSRSIRSGLVAKGYASVDLVPLFMRYLPELPAVSVTSVTTDDVEEAVTLVTDEIRGERGVHIPAPSEAPSGARPNGSTPDASLFTPVSEGELSPASGAQVPIRIENGVEFYADGSQQLTPERIAQMRQKRLDASQNLHL